MLQTTIIFSHCTSCKLAISHSGVNDVSPLRHLFYKAWSIKLLISGVPGCVHVLMLKLAIILNICYTPLLISVVIKPAPFGATHRFQRKTYRIIHSCG